MPPRKEDFPHASWWEAEKRWKSESKRESKTNPKWMSDEWFHFRLQGVFLKKTQDAVEEVTDTYLALIPEKGGQVRVTHYNGRYKSFTKYIGEAPEPYSMEMNWKKYHDPIVHFILMRDKISLFETTALGQSGTHPGCSIWSKVADTEEEWQEKQGKEEENAFRDLR